MNSKNRIPLALLMQNARVETRGAITNIMRNRNLPPYLMDGILCEILADIRKMELDSFGYVAEPEKKEEQNGDVSGES